MRALCKVVMCVSLAVLFCVFFTVLCADVHGGTGHLLGTETDWKCGTCEGGGDDCNSPRGNTCSGCLYAKDCDNENAHCRDECCGTQGETCSESEEADNMCDDGASSCPDSEAPKCVPDYDMFGYDICSCSDAETVTVSCGDGYNTCSHKY